ncbi:MAG TPA: hypothetical protein PKA00_13630 [Saprospiraceae bacterium]|nr:hypothetical protein [Saprospiraceae bacterium]HMQ83951.1 hypothetical protein [Saprospiraceae bacterium]
MRKETLLQRFTQKWGIHITDEVIDSYPEAIQEEMQYLYDQIFLNPNKTISRLKDLVKEYPKIPSIKNKLYSAYMLSGHTREAKKVLNETIHLHPNYLFGISNKILNEFDPNILKTYKN